jgi:hypothetical protein
VVKACIYIRKLQSTRKPVMVVPTGEWGAGWAATKAVEKAPMGSQHIVLTEKIPHPHAFLAHLCQQNSFR